jgi:hypothetical protein
LLLLIHQLQTRTRQNLTLQMGNNVLISFPGTIKLWCWIPQTCMKHRGKDRSAEYKKYHVFLFFSKTPLPIFYSQSQSMISTASYFFMVLSHFSLHLTLSHDDLQEGMICSASVSSFKSALEKTGDRCDLAR